MSKVRAEMKKEGLTRGETIYRYRNELTIIDGKWEIEGKQLPQRMPYKEALEYYNSKLWEAWIENGYGGTNEITRKVGWKEWWHMSSHVIDALPIKWQIRLRNLFAIGYAIGWEAGKISKGDAQCSKR